MLGHKPWWVRTGVAGRGRGYLAEYRAGVRSGVVLYVLGSRSVFNQQGRSVFNQHTTHLSVLNHTPECAS